MNPAASEPVALSQSQFSPASSAVYPPAAQHNTAVIGSLATLTACFAGLVAGILGLTNLAGFGLYLLTAVVTGLTVATVKMHGNVGRYAVQAHASSGPLGAANVSSWRGWMETMGLGQENLLGFLLFWIGGYALIHVYD